MIKHYVLEAVKLAEREGVSTLSRDSLCAHLGIAPGSFSHTMGCSFAAFMSQVVDALPLELCKSTGPRLLPALRRKQVLACAVELARTHKYWGFSRKQVADLAGVSEANVARLYTTAKLREEVVRYGIATNDADILAQARANNDKLLTN